MNTIQIKKLLKTNARPKELLWGKHSITTAHVGRRNLSRSTTCCLSCSFPEWGFFCLRSVGYFSTFLWLLYFLKTGSCFLYYQFLKSFSLLEISNMCKNENSTLRPSISNDPFMVGLQPSPTFPHWPCYFIQYLPQLLEGQMKL